MSCRDYLAQLAKLKQRVWTCSYTGKGNLTFEECLASEEKAKAQLQTVRAGTSACFPNGLLMANLGLGELPRECSLSQAKTQGHPGGPGVIQDCRKCLLLQPRPPGATCGGPKNGMSGQKRPWSLGKHVLIVLRNFIIGELGFI
jgi:hypothetical protein